MIYELGNNDRYGICVNGTAMENASFFTVSLKENVNSEKLLNAVNKALEFHPLFKTKVIYKKQYYLETNDEKVLITRSDALNRPKEFGKSTNNYPWRLCYDKCDICFEWCHVITDGKGAILFLNDILNAYYDLPLENKEKPLVLGYESMYDKNIKSLGQVKQKKGFSVKNFPVIKNGFKCQSHILSVKTEDVLRVSKKSDATPSAVIVPLLCRALRNRLPKDIKNRNVKCAIAVDCRKPSGIDTSHNFVLVKTITYTDRLDNYDLSTVSTIYRAMIDLFVDKDNIINGCTDMIDETDFLYHIKPLWLQRIIMKLVAKIVKNTMQNIGFTYLGKVPFSQELCNKIEKFGFRSWPDFGHCCVAAIDFNGTLFLDFCENFVDKELINEFIKLCADCGLKVNLEKEEMFEQASMILDL